MSGVAVNRVVVIEDDDLLSTLSSDEATMEELLDYADGDGIVCYELRVGTDVDIPGICGALDVAPSSDHDIADVDGVAFLWDEASVERAAGVLERHLGNPKGLADALCRFIAESEGHDAPADVGEVVEVLEEQDRGFEPGPRAHSAVVAAALLRRLMSALRAATRRDAAVMLL
jgi:hypothetical protein